MKFTGLSDQGKTRTSNQDSFINIVDESGNLLALVCDGVGGGNHGEIASNMTTKAMTDYFLENEGFKDIEDAQAWLFTSINKANLLVNQRGNEVEEYKGMGTTLVCLLVTKFGMLVANIGDSRAYALYNDRSFRTITVDHTYVAELVQSGQISLEEALQHPKRHVITNAIGLWPKVEVDFFRLDPEVKSVMLCSDGLYDFVSENDMIAIIKDQRLNIKTKASRLIDKANEAGGFDNITVIIVEPEEGNDHE